jgi:WD40 repeat protein
VFAPEQSVVRKTFRNQFPAWLSLLPQVDSDWDACLQTLEGHYESVNSVAFSHDSTILASASADKTIKLWNVATGVCTGTLEGHNESVNSVAFSHDSTILASASFDKTVKLWNVATNACIATFKGHSYQVYSVAFSHNSTILASAADDDTVKLWDVATGACTATLDVGAFITHLAFDATRSSLNTDVGTFTLNSPSSPSPLSTSAIPAAVRTAPPPPTPVPAPGPLPQRVDRWGIGLSEDRAWVTWDSHEVLWLPPAYRPEESAVTASTVAIGCPSGRVVLMTISSDHDLLE